jgi:hypothetical protein
VSLFILDVRVGFREPVADGLGFPLLFELFLDIYQAAWIHQSTQRHRPLFTKCARYSRSYEGVAEGRHRRLWRPLREESRKGFLNLHTQLPL